MTAPADPEDRMTRLEVKLAYAEDLLDTLNATVARQQEQIEMLARELVRLRRREDEEPAGPGSAAQERPPHY
ncbi:MAG: SlyX family protein [Burkholderiales bacterium]|nr:MAG: SlyX family protein [Burkholderiales bacterium]